MGKRINQYTELAAVERDDLVLGWDTSGSATRKVQAGNIAALAGAEQGWTHASDNSRLTIPVPWGAQAQMLSEVLSNLPAALTVTIWDPESTSGNVATRSGGVWSGTDGSKRVVPGGALEVSVAGPVATFRVSGPGRPYKLTPPSGGGAVLVTVPMSGPTPVNRLFKSPPNALRVSDFSDSGGEGDYSDYNSGTGVWDLAWLFRPGQVIRVNWPAGSSALVWDYPDGNMYDSGANGTVVAPAYVLFATDPTTSNDRAHGFEPGTFWENTVTGDLFVKTYAGGWKKITWND